MTDNRFIFIVNKLIIFMFVFQLETSNINKIPMFNRSI